MSDTARCVPPQDPGAVPIGTLLFSPSAEIEDRVAKAIEIGKIARPRNVWLGSDMPKTRSGKIMRRIIAGVSDFSDIGDVTTLANPEIVDDVRHQVQSLEAALGEVPREPTPEELEELRAFGNEQTRSRERATQTQPARTGEAAACRFPGEKREPAVAVDGEPRERKGGSNGFL
jgi:hypothetical protein